MEAQHAVLIDFANEMIQVGTGLTDWLKNATVKKVLQERQIAQAAEHHLLPILWAVAVTVVIHHRCLLLMRDVVGTSTTIITPEQVPPQKPVGLVRVARAWMSGGWPDRLA